MSLLLFIKTFGDDYLTRSVKQIERYIDTHRGVSIKVEVTDTGLMVYDNTVLLLNIHIAL